MRLLNGEDDEVEEQVSSGGAVVVGVLAAVNSENARDPMTTICPSVCDQAGSMSFEMTSFSLSRDTQFAIKTNIFCLLRKNRLFYYDRISDIGYLINKIKQ
jgi:hypothetical protein